ncbi:hypothetical protein HK405_010461 [Cladochytrium tenue]|nr:hypothetical protein HK405_010461 [Cladochytrium tenue]
MGLPFAPRRSNIVYRLLKAKSVAPPVVPNLLHAACFAGDADLFHEIMNDTATSASTCLHSFRDLKNLSLSLVELIKKSSTGGTGLIDQAVGGITLFNIVEYMPGLPWTENDYASIAAIKLGQVAILKELIKTMGLHGFANPISWACTASPTQFHDGPMFSEYLGDLNPGVESVKSSVLDWADKAIELNASTVVGVVLRWANSLREDALSRAVAAESADVVRLLLSSSRGYPAPAESVVLGLFEKTLSESVLLTIEALFERPPLNVGSVQLKSPYAFLRLPNLRGPVTEAETQFRRRALAVVSSALGQVVQDNLAMVLPALCALGREAGIEELRGAVPECGDVRRLVRVCIGAAARSGEAGVVMKLLATGTHEGPDRLAAVKEALIFAESLDRVNLAERVLEWSFKEFVPREELASFICGRLKKFRRHPLMYHCFKRALAQLL